jgi:hypothetical protein
MFAMKRSVLFIAVILSGCAGAPVAPDIAVAAQEPLTCSDMAQCDRYWQRARAWIAQFSRYGIQSATDAELTTYGPYGDSIWLAYRVARIVEPDGLAKIDIAAGCDNTIRCEPLPAQAMAAFKRYVRNGPR